MASTGGEDDAALAGASAKPGKPRRRLSWTKSRRQRFMTTLQSTLNVRHAAAAVGLTDRSAYLLKQRDADFARAWAEALDQGYAELEVELLRQSVQGSERVETVRDGEDGPIKQTKTVRSFPHGLALQLLKAHREEVLAFRLAQARRGDDEAVMARVIAQMDLVRARLLGPADEGSESGGDDEGEKDGADRANGDD